MNDLIIIGGGPAGIAAGIYASRKKLKTIFITDHFGGQSMVSPSIENWIGTEKISGFDLAKTLESHLRAYAQDIVEIKTGLLVTLVEKEGGIYKVSTNDGNTFQSKAILMATGSKRRRLVVPGADRLEHKGLTYCASCDGPLFSGMDVAVIGGGNAGFESAAQLAAYTKSVTLIHKNPDYKADPKTVAKVLEMQNVKGVTNAELIEIKGENMVQSIVYKMKDSGKIVELPVSGVFAEIGAIPNTDMVKDLVERDEIGAIKVDFKNQRSSLTGIWGAGDCTNSLYHQNNISVGDGVKALEDIYLWVKTQ